MLELYPTFPINPGINQIDYYWFEKRFSNVEIRNIMRISKLYEFQDAITQDELESGERNPDSIRKSSIKWMPPEADKTEWIYEKIMGLAMEANFNYYNFDLSHIKDAIQYTEYDESYKGEYGWHMDLGGHPLNHRKLSVIIQLSDPDDYEGGDLEFNVGGTDIIKAPRGKGNVIIFPSYLLHRVTPVTKGTRKSLVLWVGGANFR